MNTEYLTKFSDRLRNDTQLRRTFNMDTWGIPAECGTVGCIAGHIVHGELGRSINEDTSKAHLEYMYDVSSIDELNRSNSLPSMDTVEDMIAYAKHVKRESGTMVSPSVLPRGADRVADVIDRLLDHPDWVDWRPRELA